MNLSVALYIHVPFCASICPYCAFYKRSWDADLEKHFWKSLQKELSFYSKKLNQEDRQVHSVFWGGGTPNLLRTTVIQSIMNQIHSEFDLLDDVEISMEVNPGLSSYSKLAAICDASINRMSLGVQSFLDEELKFLGRSHRVKSTLKSIQIVESLLENYSIDLMIGFPNQKFNDFKVSIDQAISLNPPHISIYSLNIEPGTVFSKKSIQTATQEESYNQLKYSYKRFVKAGYHRYEFSNFSKPGSECRHNLSYWTYQPYIGCGPGAHSFFNGHRYKHSKNLSQYIKSPIHRIWSAKQRKKATVNDQVNDYLMSGLRLESGIKHSKIDSDLNIDSRQLLKEGLDTAKSLALMRKNNHSMQMTQKGIYLLNSVLELICL